MVVIVVSLWSLILQEIADKCGRWCGRDPKNPDDAAKIAVVVSSRSLILWETADKWNRKNLYIAAKNLNCGPFFKNLDLCLYEICDFNEEILVILCLKLYILHRGFISKCTWLLKCVKWVIIFLIYLGGSTIFLVKFLILYQRWRRLNSIF